MAIHKILINHTVEKIKEEMYYTIPFEVPENVDSFTVSYSYKKITREESGGVNEPCVIDIGIIDSGGRFIGWSGSARQSVTVGEFNSTNGYLRKKIKSGTWQIIVGAYRVSGDHTEVEYTIEFSEKRRRFYYGDLHVHSDASDGQYNCYELGIMAQRQGLDFIALSNHNNYSENYSLPRISGITFIPAVEWTHYKGHMNFFGPLNPFDNSFITNSAEEMKKLIAAAIKKGAVISVNHPEDELCPYLWGDDSAYEMMEIWNGPMRPANERAIKKWTDLLKTGRKISAVGGSDYHGDSSPSRMGSPVTAVYSDSQSAEDLLSSIRAGRSFVAADKNAPCLFMRCRDSIMGGTVCTDEPAVTLDITAERADGCKLFVVTATGETEITGKTYIEIPVEASRFAYIKAIDGSNAVTAVTNPIYIKKGRLK